MTEEQYIRTTNLVKLRIANNVLGDAMFMVGDAREAERRRLCAEIYGLIRSIEAEQKADPLD